MIRWRWLAALIIFSIAWIVILTPSFGGENISVTRERDRKSYTINESLGDYFGPEYQNAVVVAQYVHDLSIYLYAVAAEEKLAEEARLAEEATRKTIVYSAPTYRSSGYDVAECIKQRESGGNYSINTGNGYYGAYQFLPSTWNNTVSSMGRYDLVGVLPSNASPEDQDAAFQYLYGDGSGASHWGYAC
jgi:hypothetical protein